MFKATVGQTLNHVLPAVADIKPHLIIGAEHYEGPRERVLPDSTG